MLKLDEIKRKTEFSEESVDLPRNRTNEKEDFSPMEKCVVKLSYTKQSDWLSNKINPLGIRLTHCHAPDKCESQV